MIMGDLGQGTTSGDVNSPSTDERKLWLDYLRSLNERRLQAAQRSGWTNRVLLAILAGLLYRFVPQAPEVVKNAPEFSASLVTITLATDAVAYLLIALVFLFYYCAGGVEHRVMPEPKRRSSNIILWTSLILAITFSLFQVLVGLRVQFPSRFVRWSVISLGVWWALNVLWGLKKQVQVVRRARAQKMPVPRFTASTLAPNWQSLFAAGIVLSIAVFSSITLVVYLEDLSIHWVGPVGAASVSLTCFAICGVLFYRGLSHASEGTYEILERDILLDQLDAKEIRSRFIARTLGADTVAWLDELLAGLKTDEECLTKACESARERLQQINSIDAQYPNERNARAGRLRDDLSAAIEQHKTRVQNLQFQVEVFFDAHRTQIEREALDRWVGDLRGTAQERKKLILSAREILAQVDQLLGKKH